MQRVPRWFLCSAVSGVLAAAAAAAAAGPAASQAGIDRLKSENRGAKVSVSPATGAARFVRLGPASMLRLGTGQVQAARNSAAQEATAGAFIDRHAAAFGLANGKADLVLRKSQTDAQGWTRLTYAQQYKGVPVFGATLKAHFDASGKLIVLNGATIPDLDLSVTPSRSAREAEATAIANLKRKGMTASQSRLVVYREGLAKGVAGANHLAYEVVLTSRRSREFMYVDAHTGKFIERISGTPDALDRRAYDAQNQPAPGPNYPLNPFWEEGDDLPTGVVEADNMIFASEETYDLFWNAFGRDSFDGAGATMDSIFNRGNACPNASWNGIFISFCPGTTSDDVTGHEWGHAYTEYTDGLIYAWQPGALNEAASDVFGETVDLLNGRQTDTPDNPRTANACTAFTPLPPSVTINSPAAIAGQKPSGGAQFGPTTFALTGDVVLVNDGTGSATPPTGGPAPDLSVMDGCDTPFSNAAAVNGKIAMMYRGTCGFTVKVKNAQLNGAAGVIIANHTAGGNGAINMAGVDPTITIPSLSVGNNSGEAIRGQLASTAVIATLSRGGVGTDDSVRWLMGEDAAAFGGAIRDMASPNCYLNPAKVTDDLYHCATSDNGGVHINSGVDNRAYSLLVDGGTFNGQTVAPIGLTKAAHIWYQAKVAYQHPATDFADHADALEQSCTDLVGVNLNSLTGGGPSGQVISATDCAQVGKAVDAVEFRTPPAQCNFQPILAQGAPAVCPSGIAKKLFNDNFDNGTASMDRFTETHTAVFPADFTPRDWVVTGGLPDERPGRAFFGVDYQGGTCAPGGDESGVLHLDSPVIAVPNSGTAPRIAFDHWVATEAGWDGGNVKISVNGGAWQVIPASAFVFNDYNASLNTAAAGNTNPLAGQPAFTGSDGGSVGGSWGTSIINLSGIANKKDKIQLRFDIGTDGCSGTFGWYVDNLQVVQCR